MNTFARRRTIRGKARIKRNECDSNEHLPTIDERKENARAMSESDEEIIPISERSDEALVDEVEQDECWMREGERAMLKLRETMEKVSWEIPPSADNWIEITRHLLRISIILIWTMLYHYFFH
jgi:hypothetical protein